MEGHGETRMARQELEGLGYRGVFWGDSQLAPTLVPGTTFERKRRRDQREAHGPTGGPCCGGFQTGKRRLAGLTADEEFSEERWPMMRRI